MTILLTALATATFFKLYDFIGWKASGSPTMTAADIAEHYGRIWLADRNRDRDCMGNLKEGCQPQKPFGV